MIANTKELAVAVRSLTILEASLRALHQQLRTQNPDLLEVTSRSYEQRIASLQSEIAQYLSDHPAAVSLLLAPGTREDTLEVVLAGKA